MDPLLSHASLGDDGGWDDAVDRSSHHHLLAYPDTSSTGVLFSDAESGLAVRMASTRGQRNEASFLIRRRYGWRGLATDFPAPDPDCVTLVASSADHAVATITVGFDCPAGMAVEALYPEEVAQLRSGGARLCEFTRFAIEHTEHSLELLAMMFHIAYLYARRQRRSTHLLAEVHPRHLRFYRRMLGFEALGPERVCPRVEAPAVLMWLSLDWGERQIARYGGRPELARTMRSLYPLFFSPHEEAGIVARLSGTAGVPPRRANGR